MFPEFNIHSTPLLILVVQGLIFAVLLLIRYLKEKNISDLILSLILFVTCYQRITYTIGFMAWYDTFRNTKINYFLIPTSFIFAPLLYLYIKSIVKVNYKLRKNEWIHFLPAIIYVVYRIGIYVYDVFQPGFGETQNGVLMQSLEIGLVGALFSLFMMIIRLLYLAFSIQLYVLYRKKIEQFFSNTFRIELNWLRNFLLIYSFLFLYGLIQTVINANMMELHYTHKWWLEFLYAASIIYIGIKGYFTPVQKLQDIAFESLPDIHTEEVEKIPEQQTYDTSSLLQLMEEQKPYLNPDLTLHDLAENLSMSSGDLSLLINRGMGKNFNDFINEYRVQEVKSLIMQGEHTHKSLLGLAYDSGFNSKATFNRVFKKFSGKSPSQFISSIQI